VADRRQDNTEDEGRPAGKTRSPRFLLDGFVREAHGFPLLPDHICGQRPMTWERLVKRHPSAPEPLHSSTSGSLVATLLSLWNRALLCSGPCAGSMDHPFNKRLFDNDDSAFHGPFVRTDVLSSQHRDLDHPGKVLAEQAGVRVLEERSLIAAS
jgi:hypothetical protein